MNVFIYILEKSRFNLFFFLIVLCIIWPHFSYTVRHCVFITFVTIRILYLLTDYLIIVGFIKQSSKFATDSLLALVK